MSSYSHRRHSVELNVPGRGARTVVVEGCATGREAVRTAESMYGYDAIGPATGLRSAGGGRSSSGGGAGAIVGLGILLLPMVIIGNIVGGEETPSGPSYTPQAPIERTFTPEPQFRDYPNPPGPCVTANFEPC